MQVKIKRLNENAVIPQYAHEFDSGFDLVATEDIIVEPGATVKVPTGLAFEIPEAYEMQIRPRSGVTLKTKLRVQLGTVDSNYRGEVGVIVDNMSNLSDNYADYTEGLVNGNYLVRINDDGDLAEVEGSYYDSPQVPYLIRKGDRIAQAIIQCLPDVELIEVEALGDSERGVKGFGSSGTT